MAYDRDQFRAVITQVLKAYSLYSEAAVALLLGTAATESDFGTYLRQKGGGPARGAFQMEPATFDDLMRRRAHRFPPLHGRRAAELETDLELAILMARLKYRDDPDPLPEKNDIWGLARLHKVWYNSLLGKATTAGYVKSYKRYVDPDLEAPPQPPELRSLDSRTG